MLKFYCPEDYPFWFWCPNQFLKTEKMNRAPNGCPNQFSAPEKIDLGTELEILLTIKDY